MRNTGRVDEQVNAGTTTGVLNSGTIGPAHYFAPEVQHGA